MNDPFTFRCYRSPTHNLDQDKENPTTVKGRNGQQVKEAQGNAYNGNEVDNRCSPALLDTASNNLRANLAHAQYADRPSFFGCNCSADQLRRDFDGHGDDRFDTFKTITNRLI